VNFTRLLELVGDLRLRRAPRRAGEPRRPPPSALPLDESRPLDPVAARGVYPRTPYQKIKPHPFLIANRLLPASYVSLQSALDYSSPTWCTASPASRPNASIAGGRRWAASSSTTSSPPGCTAIAGSKSAYAFVATPEKALLDLAYLHPHADDPAFLQELRLQNLERLDLAQLRALADRSAKPKLRRFAERVAELEMETYELL
jgi:hypothetical protein